jgi:hypothetical protein
MNNLKSLLEALISEVLGGFNLSKFKAISATNERPPGYSKWEHDTVVPDISYARKFLPELGKGSSRITFALSGGKVLKIATNKAGFEQNKTEVEVFTKTKSQYVTTIFDFAPNFKWIISEIVNPLSLEKFQQIYGFEDEWEVEKFFEFLSAAVPLIKFRNFYKNRADGIRKDYDIYLKHLNFAKERNNVEDIAYFENEIEQYQSNLDVMKHSEGMLQNKPLIALLAGLTEFVKQSNLHPRDIYYEHLGLNVSGQVKLLDYGLDMATYQNFYR